MIEKKVAAGKSWPLEKMCPAAILLTAGHLDLVSVNSVFTSESEVEAARI